ncbi:HdeD family acid-resistance protein [Desulfonatronum thioautotrophicum]|uniref:HdeD family acid-resistance protein n=1 Tax=Desulfonatronum thioautotrophicum TaxID=617001 RepID=UPI0005EB5BE2|nr:DUF308 domain-containing protein [Desulfonatronum thioautotrophicum]
MQIYMKENSRLLKTEGIVLLTLGVLAIILPTFFTLAIELLIGILLLLGGAVSIYRSYTLKDMPGSFVSLGTGILSAIVGVLFLGFPLHGMIALTIFLGILFLIKGIAEITIALQHRHWIAWGWILISGFVSILIALFLLVSLPETATWAVGLLVGINMLFSGAWLLMLGSAIGKGIEV